MKHVRTITRGPAPAQGQVDPLETIIMLLLQVFFQDWDNFGTVIQNLRKYYSKT